MKLLHTIIRTPEIGNGLDNTSRRGRTVFNFQTPYYNDMYKINDKICLQSYNKLFVITFILDFERSEDALVLQLFYLRTTFLPEIWFQCTYPIQFSNFSKRTFCWEGTSRRKFFDFLGIFPNERKKPGTSVLY